MRRTVVKVAILILLLLQTASRRALSKRLRQAAPGEDFHDHFGTIFGNLGSWTGPPMQQVALADEYTLALDDSIDQLGSLFENSTFGVAIADSAFRFLTANPAFLAMLDYSSEELQQLSFLDICIDENRDECRKFLYTSCVRARAFI